MEFMGAEEDCEALVVLTAVRREYGFEILLCENKALELHWRWDVIQRASKTSDRPLKP